MIHAKTPPSAKRSAFTLVELLVVVGVIAVLIGILIPVVSRARKQALVVQCASNMRQLGSAFQVYATANDGALPATYQWAGNWMWDISREVTDLMLKNGATKEIFFCPVAYDRQHFDELWDYLQDNRYRVTGYFFFHKRPLDANKQPTANVPVLTPPKRYLENVRDLTVKDASGKLIDVPSAETELVCDVTLSNAANSFTAVYGGSAIAGATSHLDSNNAPLGGNVLFLDGHVDFRPFKDMAVRSQPGFDPKHWF